jgi:hypothetical protein
MSGIRFKYFGVVGLIIAASLFSGCSSVASKQDAALKSGIYATASAIKNGRFDLAEKFSEQVTRLVPPPTKRIAVNSIQIKGQKTVILPAALQRLPVLAIDSQAFSLAVAHETTLQTQLRAENKALGTLTKRTDDVLTAKEKIFEKAEASKPSILSRLFHWIRWLSIPLVAAGLACLCVFFPPAIPFVVGLLHFLYDVLSGIFKATWRGLGLLASKFRKNPPQ